MKTHSRRVLWLLMLLSMLLIACTASAEEYTVGAGEGGSYNYPSLSAAISALEASKAERITLKLATNITETTTIAIDGFTNLTIDLNGQTLTSTVTGAHAMNIGQTDSSTVTLTGSSTAGQFVSADLSGFYALIAVRSGSTLNIEGGAYSTTSSNNEVIVLQNQGILNISKGTFTAPQGSGTPDAKAVVNAGTLSITGGTFTAPYCVVLRGGSSTSISGDKSEFNASKICVSNNATDKAGAANTLNITGGTFSAPNGTAIYLPKEVNSGATLKDCEIIGGTQGVVVRSGTVRIEGNTSITINAERNKNASTSSGTSGEITGALIVGTPSDGYTGNVSVNVGDKCEIRNNHDNGDAVVYDRGGKDGVIEVPPAAVKAGNVALVDDSYDTVTVIEGEVIKLANSNTSNCYTSLEEALDAVKTAGGTLTLVDDVTLDEGVTLNIPSNVALTVPLDIDLKINGTMTVDGGMDVYGNLFANGTVTINNDDVEVDGSLVVDGTLNVTAGNKLTIDGAMTVNEGGTTNVSGELDIIGSMILDGAMHVTSSGLLDISASTEVAINGTLDAANDDNISIGSGNKNVKVMITLKGDITAGAGNLTPDGHATLNSTVELTANDANFVSWDLSKGPASLLDGTTATDKTIKFTADKPYTFSLNLYTPPVPTFTVTPATLSLIEGESDQLTASEEGATWATSDSKIATVDAAGKVTAVSVGKATITATSATGETATCEVTVTEDPTDPEEVVIGIKKLAVVKGKTLILPKFKGYQGTWAITDPTKARLTKKDTRVKALDLGVTTLTYTVTEAPSAKKALVINDRNLKKGDTYTIQLCVRKKGELVKSVALDVKKKMAMDTLTKKTVKLNATVSPATALDKDVFWTSSNPAVATVDHEGVVTAVAAGKAKITAFSTSLKTKKVTVTVTGAISVSPAKKSIKVGKELALKATIAEALADKTVT